MKKDIKELEEKIKRLEAEIKHGEQLLLSDVIKSLLPKKCEYCGCYDGIHRSDCYFIKKISLDQEDYLFTYENA